MPDNKKLLLSIIVEKSDDLLNAWIESQRASDIVETGNLSREELRAESKEFLKLFIEATEATDSINIDAPEWASCKSFLSNLSVKRGEHGMMPTQAAKFIFVLKKPLFEAMKATANDDSSFIEEVWKTSIILDSLGLYVAEVSIENRENTIERQRMEMLELSTPVVQLWPGILAMPLIGTLDSSRAQTVTETLLQSIVNEDANIAILDITGVPMVDTQVAQHLLKTVAAARLMGAECFISGIRPQIAQTIVHLGVELHEVETRGSLSVAFRDALKRLKINPHQPS